MLDMVGNPEDPVFLCRDSIHIHPTITYFSDNGNGQDDLVW